MAEQLRLGLHEIPTAGRAIQSVRKSRQAPMSVVDRDRVGRICSGFAQHNAASGTIPQRCLDALGQAFGRRFSGHKSINDHERL